MHGHAQPLAELIAIASRIPFSQRTDMSIRYQRACIRLPTAPDLDTDLLLGVLTLKALWLRPLPYTNNSSLDDVTLLIWS